MKKIHTTDIPQANSLRVVGEFLALADVGIQASRELSTRLRIVSREVDYYKHAARILGFVKLRNGKLVVTDRGSAYLRAKRPPEK